MPRKKKLQKGDLVFVYDRPRAGGLNWSYGIIIDCDEPDKYTFPWLVLRPNGFKKWERDHNVKLMAKAKQ